jgi:hypothetical protein|tara:strand:+ start:354 stop:587 length:234 start_codon:yes stop_codon:yes gene_type:complete
MALVALLVICVVGGKVYGDKARTDLNGPAAVRAETFGKAALCNRILAHQVTSASDAMDGSHPRHHSVPKCSCYLRTT